MFSKILYAHDFSPESEAAFAYVKKLKEAGTKEVFILHVFDEKRIDLAWELKSEIEDKPIMKEKKEILNGLVKKAEDRLQRMKQELLDLGLETKVILMTGIPSQNIVKAADDLDVSLIVMGARGEGAFKELLVGSTAMRVVREATRPVLVVKPKSKL